MLKHIFFLVYISCLPRPCVLCVVLDWPGWVNELYIYSIFYPTFFYNNYIYIDNIVIFRLCIVQNLRLITSHLPTKNRTKSGLLFIFRSKTTKTTIKQTLYGYLPMKTMTSFCSTQYIY